jgi:hypothetical protein
LVEPRGPHDVRESAVFCYGDIDLFISHCFTFVFVYEFVPRCTDEGFDRP